MSARIIDGKAIAADSRSKVAAEVTRIGGQAARAGGGAGRRQSRQRSLREEQAEGGGRSRHAAVRPRLPETVSEAEVLALIGKLNADPAVHGILVQLPLPQADRHATR